MDRKDYWAMLAIAVVAGFVGGVVSSRVLTVEPAIAQDRLQVQKDIAAETFFLVDKDRKAKARLSFDKKMGVALVFYDEKENPRLVLGSNHDGTPLGLFFDDKGMDRIKIVLTKNGQPQLTFHDGVGIERVFIGDDDTGPYIHLGDKNMGSATLSAEAGTPYLSLRNAISEPAFLDAENPALLRKRNR
jgi:hypothetical protein